MMIYGALAAIDMFGTPIQMNFSRKQKAQSHLGGICSILLAGFLFWAIYNASKELFARENPKTITSETFQNDPREMIINTDQFPLAFGIQAPTAMNSIPFKNASIYELSLEHAKMIRTIYSNGTINEQWIRTEIVLEKCSAEYFGELSAQFADLDLDSAFCIAKNQPDLEQISIKGSYSSPEYEALTVKVSSCDNSTMGGTCATPGEIDTYLAGARFNVLFGNTVMDPKNFSRPDKRYRDIYYTMISPANYKEAVMELSYMEVSTDVGWLTDEIGTKPYMKMAQANDFLQLQASPDKVLITAIIEVSKLESYYSRVYKKIQDVFAEVSGLFNVAFVAALILAKPYAKLKFQEALMNELFIVKDEPSEDRQKKKYKRKSSQRNGSIPPQNTLPNVEDKNKEDKSNQNKSRQQKKPKALEIVPKRVKVSLTPSVHINHTVNTNRSARDGLLAPGTHLGSIFQDLPDKDFEKSPSQRRSNKLSSSLIDIPTPTQLQTLAQLPKIEDGDRSSPKNKITPTYWSVKDLEANAGHNRSHSPREENIFDFTSRKETVQKSQPYYNYAYDNLGMESPKRDLEEDGGIKSRQINKEDVENEFEDIEDDDIRTPKADRKDEEVGEAGEAEPGLDKIDEEVLKNAGIGEESQKMDLTVWEYILSFIYRTDSLENKMKLLERGRKNIDERLNVVNILKKLREVDKLKALLLDPDQFILFNNLPKPEICLKSKNLLNRAFSLRVLRRSTFIPNETRDQILWAHRKIREKTRKTDIEERILQIFDHKDEA